MNKLSLVPVSLDRNSGISPMNFSGLYSALIYGKEMSPQTSWIGFGNELDRRSNWGHGATLMPSMDIVEMNEKYQLTAELPGVDENDIDISFLDGLLTISGEKKEMNDEENKNYHLGERWFGKFQRSFPLPANIDWVSIEASFKDGLLTINIPKPPKAGVKANSIPISTG